MILLHEHVKQMAGFPLSHQWWRLQPGCTVLVTLFQGLNRGYLNADGLNISTPLREAGVLDYFMQKGLHVEPCQVEDHHSSILSK